ncbi:RICIN domain-containing protein [Streptomyces sp. SD31]|uniref:RICIN domain-containing protein n=1 Tax=Streptomyces sp. SD31 TaxID=3452208 RepID=UPI003F89A342
MGRAGLPLPHPRPRTLPQGDGTYKIRNENSGKLLAIANNSTAVGAFAVQDSDDGTADNRGRILRD